MRKYLLLFFSLFALTLQAQKLTIDRFEETNEITASQYPRQDANGEACALIKVEVMDNLIKAEGGTVGDIVTNANEKWVYIIAHQRVLKFHFANHLPVEINTRDYDMPTGLKANVTYVLTLNDNAAASSAVPDAGKQYLVMTVKPTNATVFLDNNLKQLDADGSLMAYLPYGQYTYRVMAEGYKEQSGVVTVGRDRSELNVSLTSTKATLSVSCPTASADIYVNGNRMGSGSWRGQLAAGTYSLEAKRTGYRSASSSVTLVENEERAVTLPALSPLYGSLNVNYSPVNAEVWLDGTQIGKSPNIFRNVGVGSHRVEIKKSGYETKSLNVSVAENQTADLSGSLLKLTASSSSVSSPSSSSSGVSGDAIRTFYANGVSFNMVRVDGGTFKMGANSGDSEADSDEKPLHEVTLSSYYIGQTEVTQALWKAVMGSNPSRFQGDNLPVEQVSWNDCQTFISKLNALTGQQFGLPTEAEWEFAARGGNKSQNYKYSGSNNLNAIAWYDSNSSSQTHAVGTKQANELGIYDMTGNVWEWCSDWYGSYSSSSQTNPTGPSSGSYRVERGGSWINDARSSRVSYRYNNTPTHRNYYLGLRLLIHKAQ